MKEVIENYYCDYCKNEMSNLDYKIAPNIKIRVDLPNPKGGPREIAIADMVLCEKCSEGIGLVNSEEYHTTIHASTRLFKTVENIKTNILGLVFKKNREVDQ